MATPILDGAIVWWRACDYVGLTWPTDPLPDGSGNGHNAQLGSLVGADTNDPLFLSPDSYTDYDNPGTQYLYKPTKDGANYCSLPDIPAYNWAASLDVRLALRRDNWASTGWNHFCGNYDSGTGGFYFGSNNSNYPQLGWVTSGGSPTTGASTALFSSFASAGELWCIRVTLLHDNGSTAELKYYYKATTAATAHTDCLSDSGWTQLGNTVTPAKTSIGDSADILSIGTWVTDTNGAPGGYYAFVLLNSIDGTPVVDVDFTDRSNVVEPFTTFTESSANAATVTINRSATGRKSCVVDYPKFLLGTDDYLETADHADLQFGLMDSLTVLQLLRFTTAGTAGPFLAKCDNLARQGYSIEKAVTDIFACRIEDSGGHESQDLTADLTDQTGYLKAIGLVRNTMADTVEAYVDGVGTGSPTTDASTDGIDAGDNLVIGSTANHGAFQDFEFVGAAIFRSALSAEDLVAAANELMGNEPPDPVAATAGRSSFGITPSLNIGL